jgi:peptidoglycan/xylan/chitin deacetylase (PgdA/CDA1 family)
MVGFPLGVAAASAALAATGYQSLAPTGQWFGRAFHGLRPGSKQIALTFDDGPNEPYTQQLLELLARHNVRATIFVIGRYVRERPDLARAIAQVGHEIGNHTFSHPPLIFERPSRVRREILEARQTIGEAVGVHSCLFRPPWGARRPGLFAFIRQLGLEPVMWNVTGYDWNPPSAESIIEKVSRRIRGGDVILLHDGSHHDLGADRSKTVAAVRQLIAQLKAGGYQFATVSDMIGASASAANQMP